ncbi:MAG: ribonuclease III [Nitrospirae bacterium]|nr:ribonuclease III [Nitrospirota bacterium]
MKDEQMRDLEKRLSYNFMNIDLLKEAVTHKSYVNENPDLNAKDNERLEFLGDAVLDLSISSYLVENFPQYQEGELSKFKSMMVSEPSLSKIASELDIGEYLLLGRGEEHTGGRKKESLLANALEAIIAAIYFDGGLPAADRFVRMVFVAQIQTATREGISLDYKTDLQEYCQGHDLELPSYRVSKEMGPDHKKTFEVELLINGEVLGLGIGKNKKEAEQRAAKETLKYLTSKS